MAKALAHPHHGAAAVLLTSQASTSNSSRPEETNQSPPLPQHTSPHSDLQSQPAILDEARPSVHSRRRTLFAGATACFAVLFGYRKLLVLLVSTPIYLIVAFLIAISFNVVLPYWLRKREIQPSKASPFSLSQRKKALYKRMSVATPAAYSASLTRKTWEAQTTWRSQSLHPQLDGKTADALDRVISKIMRDFVWKWYDGLVPPPYTNSALVRPLQNDVLLACETYSSSSFPLAVEKIIRHVLRFLFSRLESLDLPSLVVHKILPILTRHVQAFRQAEDDLKGGASPTGDGSRRSRRESRSRLYRAFYSSGNDEIDLLLARLHADALKRMSTASDQRSGGINSVETRGRRNVGLHPAVDVPTPNSQSSEQAYLRKLVEKILPLVLPSPEKKSVSITSLVTELLTCSVIGPVIEMLSDSDFWNKLIDERAGNVIREQQMVEQLRQVLNEQVSSLNGATKGNLPHSSYTSAHHVHSASSNQFHTKDNILRPEDLPGQRRDDAARTSVESISIKSSAKDFEQFSKSIQRCKTLFDVRRLKNDIETQIRKTEVALASRSEASHHADSYNHPIATSHEFVTFEAEDKNRNELLQFLKRLRSARQTADHRIAELGGSSGPGDHAGGLHSPDKGLARSLPSLQDHLVKLPPKRILQAILRDRESSALSYFTEFMDRRHHLHLLQFWLAVEGLKNPLEEDVSFDDRNHPKSVGRGPHRSYPSSISEDLAQDLKAEPDWESMKSDLEAIAEINFTTPQVTDMLGLRRDDVIALLEFLSPTLAKSYQTSVVPEGKLKGVTKPIRSMKDARASLFSMQHQVFDMILTQDLPAFSEAGDLYLQATASLRLTKPQSSDETTHEPSSPKLPLSGSDPRRSSKFSSRFPFSPFTKFRAPQIDSAAAHKGFDTRGQLRPYEDQDLATHADRPLPLKRANSEDALWLGNSDRLTTHMAFSGSGLASMATKAQNNPDSHLLTSSFSNVWQPRDGSNASHHPARKIAPPQVTLQAAFDERLPSERLTGVSPYHQHSRSRLSGSGQVLSGIPPHMSQAPTALGTQISSNQTRVATSSSLDFLMSPFERDRAPLFQDDLDRNPINIPKPTSSTVPRSPGSSTDKASLLSPDETDGLFSHSYQVAPPENHRVPISTDTEIALQEALTSIISTSDSAHEPKTTRVLSSNDSTLTEISSFPSPHLHSGVLQAGDDGNSFGSQNWKKVGYGNNGALSSPTSPSRDSSLLISHIRAAPTRQFIERKGLFDDDEEHDEDDEFQSSQLGSQTIRSSTNISLSSSNPTMYSGRPKILNISDADEQITRLDNELDLLSGLMRRAELTGNKLEIRLVKKSIESASSELSDVIYQKERLIDRKEIAMGGFRGKLVPGRVKVAITGTTTGTSPTARNSIMAQSPNLTSLQTRFGNSNLQKNNMAASAAGFVMGNGGQEFVLYTIEVHKLTEEDGTFGSGWIVMRRYSEFSKLHQSLKEHYPISRQLEFPAKILALGLGGSGNRALVEQRKVALERYLKALIHIPVLCESPELAQFLSRSKANLPTIGPDSSTSLRRQLELFSGSGFLKAIYKSIAPGSYNLDDDVQATSPALQYPSMFEAFIGGLKQQASDITNGFSPGFISPSQEIKHSAMSKAFGITVASDDVQGSNRAGKIKNHEGADTPLETLSESVRPIEEEFMTAFTAPICDFLIEVFDLNDKDQWLRKQGIVIVLQQILGDTIERKFRETVTESFKDDNVAQLVVSLEEALWLPNNEGGKLKPPSQPRTFEEKIITRDAAYRKLSAIIPDLAASVLGRSNARIATRRLFAMCQNRRLNKHLIYTIIDEIIASLFPEIHPKPTS